jgi:hypothetical protein
VLILLAVSIISSTHIERSAAQSVQDDIDKLKLPSETKVSGKVARGEDWRVESIGLSSYRAEIGLPNYVLSDYEEKYVGVEYFRDEGKKAYDVETALISARIFDSGVVEFYNKNFSDLQVKNEEWILQAWDGKEYKTVSLGSPSFTVSQNNIYVNISRSHVTSKPDGLLEILYVFQTGSGVKHFIYFTPDNAETVNILQSVELKDSTVKAVLDDGVEYTVSGKTDSKKYRYLDSENNLVVYEDQTDANRFIGADLDFSGKKAVYTFGNWSLQAGETLELDPYTFTISGSSNIYDGDIRDDYVKDDSGATIFVGAVGPREYRGFLRFNISVIPDGASITDVDFNYTGLTNTGGTHQVTAIVLDPSTASNQAVYEDAGNGTVYISGGGFPVVGAYQQVDLGANADTDLENGLTNDRFSIGLNHSSADNGDAQIDSVDGAIPPFLIVEFSIVGGVQLNLNVFANDNSTEISDIDTTYISLINASGTFQQTVSSGWFNISGQTWNSIVNISAQIFNTTVSNSHVLVNKSNILSFNLTDHRTEALSLSVYQNVSFNYLRNNGTSFTPTSFRYTAGNNGTLITASSSNIILNGSNTVRDLNIYGDNVIDNSTFTASADNSTINIYGRLYTVQLSSLTTDNNDLDNIQYNLTMATNGTSTILLAADSTVWWNGLLVNQSSSLTITQNTAKSIATQVGDDGEGKTLFAEGTNINGNTSMIIDSISADYQSEPVYISMNSTIYTSLNFTGTWNYSAAQFLLNLTHTDFKSVTNITNISINLVDMWVDFDAEGSVTEFIVYYAIGCTGADRTIRLREESTGLTFDTPGYYSVNVSAFYDTYYTAVSVNQTSFTVCGTPLLVATVISPTGATYFRTLIPSDDPQNMYLVDLRTSAVTLFTLNIIDMVDDYEAAIIRVYSSGSEVASGRLDSGYKFGVYLINGRSYSVNIYGATQTFNDGSINANPEQQTVQITVGNLIARSDRSTRSDVVVWAAAFIGANVVVDYDDSAVLTSTLRIRMYEQTPEYRNYSLVFDQTYVSDSSVVATFPQNTSRAYYVIVDYTHSTYGSISENRPLYRSGLGVSLPSFPSDTLGMNQWMPNVAYAWIYVISTVTMVGAASIFSAQYALRGAVIVSILGLFLSGIGFLPIPVIWAGMAVVLAVLANVAAGRGT